MKKCVQSLGCLLVFGLLSACGEQETRPILSSAQMATLIPDRISATEKATWATDIAAIFETLDIYAGTKNVCTAIAVIDQESNFVADPAVPNLGKTSYAALDSKLEEKLGKTMASVFRTMLNEKPTVEHSFAKQIQAVKTERELDELFRAMFAYFGDAYKVGAINKTAKLLNNGIDERLNPITTLGSMQVHIDYAKSHRRTNMNDDELRADLYSRYGGLYYGIHRLLLYPADYSDPMYRFADYNSGMYSSRNAAFQSWIVAITGQKMALDGDLLLYKDGDVLSKKSQTETILSDWVAKQQADFMAKRVASTSSAPQNGASSPENPYAKYTPAQIRQDFKKEKSHKFEQTPTYQWVKALYEQKTKKQAEYAIMPQVVISGVKLSKDYNTQWYATNVNKRYQRCIATAKKQGFEVL